MHALKPWDQGLGARTLAFAVAYWGLIAAFAIEYLRVHQLAAFTFPVPWEDESQYLWMAISFADAGSLNAPQVASRPLFMMPPGHMVFVGTLFKVFGASLSLARLVSALLVTGSFVLLASITAHYGLRFLSLLFCGVFFLSRPSVAAGNLGRMEALLLFTACLGTLLLQRRHHLKGLAVLLVGPLIHPNGTYFLAAAMAYLLVTRRISLRLTGSDAAWLLVSLTLWGVYLFDVSMHWPLFRQDMAYQFGIKLGRDIWGQLFIAGNWPAVVTVVLCTPYAVWAGLDVIFLLILGIPAWLAYGIGHEMWYRLFDYLLYPLLSVIVLHVVCDLGARITPFLKGRGRYGLASVTAAVLMWWHYQTGRVEHPGNFPWDMVWGRMRIRRDISYVTEADIVVVGAFLDSLRSAGGIRRVRFYPEADSLLFHRWEKNGVRFSQPFFSGTGAADVYIVHTSRALPAWMQNRAQQELRGTAAQPSAEARLLQQRDGTEAWYYCLIPTAP